MILNSVSGTVGEDQTVVSLTLVLMPISSVTLASPFTAAQEQEFVSNAVISRTGAETPAELQNYKNKVSTALGAEASNPSRRDSRRTAFLVFSQAMSATTLTTFATSHGLDVMAGEGHMASTTGGTVYSFGVRDIGVFEGTLQQKMDFMQERHELLSDADNTLRNQESSTRSTTTVAEANAVADAELWYFVAEVISSYYILNQLLTNPSVDTVILKTDNAEGYDKLLANITPLARNVSQYETHFPAQSSQSNVGTGFSTLDDTSTTPQSLPPNNIVFCGPSSTMDDRCPMDHMYAPSRNLIVGGKSTAYGIHRNGTATIGGGQTVDASSMTTGDTLKWGNAPTTYFTDSGDPRAFGTLAFDGSLSPKCNLNFNFFGVRFDCGSGGTQDNGIFVPSAGYEAELKVEDTECNLPLRTGTVEDMFSGCFFPYAYQTSFPGSSAPYLDTTFLDDGDVLSAAVGVRFANRLQAGIDYENTVYSYALGVQHQMVGTDDAEQRAQIGAPISGCSVFGSAFCMFNLEQYSLNDYIWLPSPF